MTIVAYDGERSDPLGDIGRLRQHYGLREVEILDITTQHNEAFPIVDVGVFADLPNPDALVAILTNYLTFAVMLDGAARETVGFSELGRIHAVVSRLKASRLAAQRLTWPLFAAARKSLMIIEQEARRRIDAGVPLRVAPHRRRRRAS